MKLLDNNSRIVDVPKFNIAIQGDRGSFHEIAALKYFKENVKDIIYCRNFLDVFRELDSNKTEYAVVATGNNRYGDINHVYDILLDSTLNQDSRQYQIIGEIYININQCLIGLKGTKIEDIREVHSQSPAIIQSMDYIKTNLTKCLLVNEDDTALSCRKVKELNDKSKVAIASKEAAEIYGLEILAENIQDDINNLTRFIVIKLYDKTNVEGANKTTLIIRTTHQPGSLVKSLDTFSKRNINIAFLQSFPIPNRPFEYRFYLEVESGIKDMEMIEALVEINKLGFEYVILGSYKKANLPKVI